MGARTLVFGGSGVGAGFKYTPTLLACALFPHLADPEVRASLPRKRRKVVHSQDPSAGEGSVRMDVDDESGDERHAVVLESDSETYLIAPGPGLSEGYVLSVFLPTPTDGKGSGIGEAPVYGENIPTSVSQVEPSAGENSIPIPTPGIEVNAPKDDQQTPVSDPQVKLQLSSPPSQSSSVPPSPEKPVPQSSHTKIMRSNLRDKDFNFEQDCVVVCARGEETGVMVKVMRWRWYL